MSKIDQRNKEPTPALSVEMFRDLVEQSIDITAVIDSTGQIRYISPSVQTILGYCPIASCSMVLLDWIHPGDRPQLRALLPSSWAEPQSFSSRFRHQLGHWVPCSLVVQELTRCISQNGDESQDKRCFHLNLHPQALATSKEPMAFLSHELRTPINAINGFSQLLLQQRRSPLAPDQEDMVQRILTNGRNLLNLINTILDFSRLEAGQMPLTLETINVADLINRTIGNISSLAIQNKIKFHTEIQLSDPLIVNDSMWLKQILLNLLSNAIHVSREGAIQVKLDDHDPDLIMISVQDSGPGIAPGEIDLLFGEFWQIEQSSTPTQARTGLGLAICHRLVQMMKGDIQVQSQLGHGATFRIVIPRHVSG